MRTATNRAVSDVKALLQISHEMHSAHDWESLERKLAELLFEVAPIDRAVVWLLPELPRGNSPISGWERNAQPVRGIEIEQEIAERAIAENAPVIRDQAAVAEMRGGKAGKVREIAAFPMSGYKRVLGVLYLESDALQECFDESRVQLLSAISELGGVVLENVMRLEWLESRNRELRGRAKITHELVGRSPLIQEVVDFIARVAPKESTVLICGESGTGKELAARAIHANSGRAHKPFVAINCAALTDTLLESELFGHEKGSFTGAITQKKGKLETAEGGTVFLDEVGEMSPGLQSKVLRVLQEREFERVGGTKTHKLNIRLIAATNRDLREESQRGAFRADLFYRLNVLSITMPSLRARQEDIPMLAEFLAAKHGTKSGRPVMGVSREARLLLMDYDWPGNVRELENAIERAVVLGTESLIQAGDLPSILTENKSKTSPVVGLAEGVREAKRQLILKALDQTGGSHARAAELLGVHANHLSRLITTLDLRSRVP